MGPALKITDDIYLVGSGEVGLSNRYDCHVYLLNGDDESFGLIDAGSGLESDKILINIRREGFNPDSLKYVLVTHCHADHASGCLSLKQSTGCQVIASAYEARLIEGGSDEELGLVRAKLDACYPQDYAYNHCKVDRVVGDGETVAFGRSILKAIITPGHSKGHTCYLMRREGSTLLFSGDEVFLKGMISLLNCYGSSLEDYNAGIAKLKDLSVDTLLPSHGLFTLKDGQRHINLAYERLRAMWPPLNTGWDRDLRPYMV